MGLKGNSTLQFAVFQSNYSGLDNSGQ